MYQVEQNRESGHSQLLLSTDCWGALRLKEYPPLQWTMLMMPLWRTPLLPPGWGLSRPSHAGIGASSAAGAAASAVGAGHGGGRRSVVTQTAFGQLPHFSEVFGVLGAARGGGPAAVGAAIDPNSSCRSLFCASRSGRVRVRRVASCGLACVCAEER